MAGHADYQARWLRDEQGITDVALLLDPEQRLRRAVDLGRLGYLRMLSPASIRHYLAAFGSGQRPGRIVEGHDLRPGVVLMDPAGRAVRVWRGRSLGDYPPVDEVLAELAARAGRS